MDLCEQLAAIEHERWSHWQRYLHDACQHNEDGSLTIPARFVEHWERQIATPYGDLSEREKASDREQVNRYWPLIVERLLPEGGTTCEEWRVTYAYEIVHRVKTNTAQFVGTVDDVRVFVSELHAEGDTLHFVERQITTRWPNGMILTGPWELVSDTTYETYDGNLADRSGESFDDR